MADIPRIYSVHARIQERQTLSMVTAGKLWKKNHRALGQLDENDSSFLSVRCFARLQKSAKEQMLWRSRSKVNTAVHSTEMNTMRKVVHFLAR